MTEEPHRSRRKAIMKAHPEVSIRLLPLVSFSVVSCHVGLFEHAKRRINQSLSFSVQLGLFARNSSPDRCGLIDT